jgi:hypothetical protein
MNALNSFFNFINKHYIFSIVFYATVLAIASLIFGTYIIFPLLFALAVWFIFKFTTSAKSLYSEDNKDSIYKIFAPHFVIEQSLKGNRRITFRSYTVILGLISTIPATLGTFWATLIYKLMLIIQGKASILKDDVAQKVGSEAAKHFNFASTESIAWASSLFWITMMILIGLSLVVFFKYGCFSTEKAYKDNDLERDTLAFNLFITGKSFFNDGEALKIWMICFVAGAILGFILPGLSLLPSACFYLVLAFGVSLYVQKKATEAAGEWDFSDEN